MLSSLVWVVAMLMSVMMLMMMLTLLLGDTEPSRLFEQCVVKVHAVVQALVFKKIYNNIYEIIGAVFWDGFCGKGCPKFWL
jgi:chromate transport protein ChrA